MPQNRYRFDCSRCLTPCDGISKLDYHFEGDAEYSERKEQALINQINTAADFHAEKTEDHTYPDIIVTHLPTNKEFYIEVKAQRRTFMTVEKCLPEGDLLPSETVACNQSDLERYISIRNEINKPVYVLWCLENRPCIVENGKTAYFYQNLDELKRIFYHYGNKRRFRRRGGAGDIVDGVYKGVVVNYHFSLKELREVHLSQLLQEGIR